MSASYIPSDSPTSPSPSSSSSSNHSSRRYQPYVPRERGSILPGLHYAARSLGIMTPTDVTPQEAEEKRDAFIDTLSAMPDVVLLAALDFKRADHERHALRLALANAEIKSSECHMTLLSAMDQYDGAHPVSEALGDTLDTIFGVRSQADVESSKEYYENALPERRAALTVSELHIAQMQDVIYPRVSRRPEEGFAWEDPFRTNWSEDPFVRYSTGEDSSESGDETETEFSSAHVGSQSLLAP